MNLNTKFLPRSIFVLIAVLLFSFSTAVSYMSAQEPERDTARVERESAQSINADETVRVESESSEQADIRCDDGVCTEETVADSVCNGYLCDDGTCTTSEEMCGLDEFAEEVTEQAISDGVCSGYLCPNGECTTSQSMCTLLEDLPAAVSTIGAGASSATDIQTQCRSDEFCRVVAEAKCADGICSVTSEVCTDQQCVVQNDSCSDGSCTRISHVCGERCGTEDYNRVDYNNSRSNRATAAGPDTNVCDGATCPDGTCVATPDMCGMSDSERANYNNSRSNRANVASPDDTDIIDEDDVIRPAQEYNPTRSNRRKNTFFNPDNWLDDDDDNDGIPTLPANRVRDWHSEVPEVRCGATAAVRDEGSLWCWGQGVRAAATGEADEDGTVATSTRVLQHLSVRGDDVRAWSDEQRAQFQEYKNQIAGERTPERLTAEITDLVLNNERITDMTITDTEATVQYKAQMRLFGIIPMEREVTARGSDSDDLTIDYPWYSFLASKPDTSNIQSIFVSLATTISSGGGGAGKATFTDIKI